VTRPALVDGLRLALGTLTAVPVRPPGRVDAGVAGTAMALAAVPGVLLGVLAAATVAAATAAGAAPPVAALLAVGSLALATRGLHLDGLGDTADGLAASDDRRRALEVMRRGDVGPAGVTALVLVLLLQVAALSAVVDARGPGTGAVVALVAAVAGRAALAGACARGVPAARSAGLGAAVAGSVPRGAAVAVGGVVALLAAVLGTAVDEAWWWLPAAVLAGWLAAAALLLRCVRRLGGVSGDVLGAVVETAVTACLVVASLQPRPW
jgi:adenosylcobinamide-GDP ribazoletransferase